jgi:hypothetical protein
MADSEDEDDNEGEVGSDLKNFSPLSKRTLLPSIQRKKQRFYF